MTPQERNVEALRALEQALEALEALDNTNNHWWQEVDKDTVDKIEPAITALKEVLSAERVAQQRDSVSNEQVEPVAWGNLANWCLDSDRVLITDKDEAEKYHKQDYDLTPLYTHPPVPTAHPEQEPVANRGFLERMLAAMEGVIDVADRKTKEFDALRACIVDLTLMLYTTRPQHSAIARKPLTVDCIGLALELEAQAKRVESQTVERTMLAAANGLLNIQAAHGIKE